MVAILEGVMGATWCENIKDNASIGKWKNLANCFRLSLKIRGEALNEGNATIRHVHGDSLNGFYIFLMSYLVAVHYKLCGTFCIPSKMPYHFLLWVYLLQPYSTIIVVLKEYENSCSLYFLDNDSIRLKLLTFEK